MTDAGRRIDSLTLVVLFLTLVGYPLVRCCEVLPVPATGTRADWWWFWCVVAAGHWACFGCVAFALWRRGESWSTVGVDWGWFRRRRVWLLTAGASLVAAAFVAPAVHYDSPPRHQGLFPLQPASTAERLLWIVGAGITAGVVEETVFRGFALTRLRLLVPAGLVGLPISVIAFVFLHGVPVNITMAANYAFAGLLFGGVFLWLRRRRLELLMVAHGGINAVFVFLP